MPGNLKDPDQDKYKKKKSRKWKQQQSTIEKKVCPKMQRVGFDFGNNCDMKGVKPPAGPPLAI